MKTCSIGYMINESGIVMEDVEIIDSPQLIKEKISLRFHNPARLIGFGHLQTAYEKNRNGRIYKREDLEREINAPRQRELLNAGQLCGEAGHPIGEGTQSLVRQQTIDPTRTCVRFLKIWMENNDVLGYFEGTNNCLGETFDKDLRTGIKPAFSLRALGTLKSTAEGAIVENLKMITYDYVIFPSHPGAYTIGIMNESATGSNVSSNFSFRNNMDATKSYMREFNDTGILDKITNKYLKESAVNYILEESKNFKKLKDSMDISKYDTIDLIGSRKLSLTEAGKSTIVLDIEDYISQEIQNYF